MRWRGSPTLPYSWRKVTIRSRTYPLSPNRELVSRALRSIRSRTWPPVASATLSDPVALAARQEPVDDLPLDERPEHGCVGRGIEEANQPHNGVQQVRVQRAHVDGRHREIASRLGATGLHHHRSDKRRVE